ncbi:MAG: glutathione-disulfide reductase, partial [Hyphomicrobiaceae bacterium]
RIDCRKKQSEKDPSVTDYDYDLFVIGAGSGGVRAARMAAGHGARVGIAEEYRVGGTCVIRGCVPKKLFAYASRFGDDFEDAKGFGWSADNVRFDWPTLKSNKDAEIDRLNGIYLRNLEASGVTIHQTRAVLDGPHTIRFTATGESITAKFVLIATGGWPYKPDIEGANLGITSNDAFELEQLPKSIIVVGGGYIAVEFAGIFNGLGVETELHYRGPKILRGFDEDLRDVLTEEMSSRGVRIVTNSDPSALTKSGETITMKTTDGETHEAEMVMFATGRNPNTENLELNTADVNTGAKGKIIVDKHSKSNIDHIYAVGDVTDREALTPVAIHEGMAFAETVFNDNPTPIDHYMIPTAVFSEPEIGTVGMTEDEARAAHPNVDIYKSRFKPMKHTLSGRNERMLMKLIVNADNDRVLGCHVVGPDAAEMIQMTAIAMRMGATKADFDATRALHPSAAEEFVTMREKWQPPARQEAAE